MTSILERHQERLDANPADEKAFLALEEHHFLAGEWDALIALYEQRLEAPDLEAVSPARAALLLREAQVWEERKQDLDQATECYERAQRADPTTPTALGQLRRIHVSRQRWDLALQIADHAYVMESGALVMEGPARELANNSDVKEFYLGIGESGARRSYRNVKHYRRRKRWLS